ncbi:MAG TPA: hypothetical protein VFN26_12280 [Candidatus Acidoferrum sp.]|nr:hypothetical protein [Candidatus Acidoferrum sp.]
MMRTRSIAFAIAALLLVALTAYVSTAAADDMSGTWKMNSAKSKFSPGPAPKELTVKIEADENHFKINADGTNDDGTPLHVAYDAKFDGKDYPATGLANADSVSVKRLKGGGIESQQKKGGQVLITVTSVVSKDGKTRTSTWKGKDAQGRDINNVVVFDKQ